MSEENFASGIANGENFTDIENRHRPLRTVKNVVSAQQKPALQRVALGNITSKSTNVRVGLQATTKTKLNNFADNGAVKISQPGRGQLVSDATASFRAFSIHQDEDPVAAGQDARLQKFTAFTIHQDEACVPAGGEARILKSTATAERHHIDYSAVESRHNLDTSMLSSADVNLSGNRSLDTSDLASVKDSPMVMEVSCLEDRETDSRVIDRELYFANGYSEDIYQNLRKSERKNRAKPAYLKKQQDITTGMRGILVDWLVEVGEEYKLQNETLYLAVNYIDRFLSCMSVLRGKLQLVGTAAMFIAAKFEEIYPPDVAEFVYITDDTYTKKQVLRMEHLILKVLSFDLVIPTIHCFLQRYSKLDDLDDTTESLAMYLAELTLLEADPYLYYDPSIIAAAAVCLANHTTGREPWSATLSSSSGYEMSDFYACVVCLNKTFCEAANSSQQAIREKYKSSKFHQVSNLTPPSCLPS